MNDTQELYQELLLDHNNAPRNYGELPAANRSAEGHNPLCGDEVTVHLVVSDGVIADIRFEGSGCAISTASASLMTEAVRGKTVDEARALFGDMVAMLTGDPSEAAVAEPHLGKLGVFSGVREYPMRVKCATLAWHTLNAALREGSPTTARGDVRDASEPVSTE